MRRPAVYASVIVVVLLALGSPFLRVVWGGTDATVLPASAAPRVVTEVLQRDFPGNPTAPIEAVVHFEGPVAGSTVRNPELAGYVRALSHVPGIGSVLVTGVHGDVARVDMGYASPPNSPQAELLVKEIRQVSAPPNSAVSVGGQSAQLVDTLSSLSHTLPYMILGVTLATLVMLFLAFGSVVLPLKAIVMNILSLSVMYGVLVWVFQEGHLSGVFHFTPNGTINPTTPILMFAIMFGLSMDYEVFLLSRIREHYVATGNNTEAIATGLQRTGGIITSAALLLLIVVGPFALSGVTFTKMLGVGMIVALIVDATVIRVLLVPATMKLLGDKNWWAPRSLRRFHDRHGLQEEGASASSVASTAIPEIREPVPV
jgi:RND superfamily putative drug exporter